MAAMPAAGAAAAARCGASLLTPRRARRLVQLVRSATAAGGDVEVGTAAERETYLEIASRPSRFQESQWGPEDASVRAMLAPWRGVFEDAAFRALVVRCVVPRLAEGVRSADLDPGAGGAAAPRGVAAVLRWA